MMMKHGILGCPTLTQTRASSKRTNAKHMKPAVCTCVFPIFDPWAKVILAFGGSRLNASERNISRLPKFCEFRVLESMKPSSQMFAFLDLF